MALFSSTQQPAPRKAGDRPQQDLMPVGTHKAKVVHVIPGQTSTGKVRFGIKFENEAGEVAWYNCVAPDGSNPKHTRFFYKTMDNLSIGRRFLDDDKTTPEDVAEALVGSEALVTVADEEYRGVTYRKVTFVDALGPFDNVG